MAEMIPRLGVRDLERELKFYGALGFEVGERTTDHAIVLFQGISLSLHQWDSWRVTDRPLLDWGKTDAFGSGVQLYVDVANVEELAGRIPVGVPRPWPVQDKPWGARELTLRTPSGYLLTFAQKRGRAGGAVPSE